MIEAKPFLDLNRFAWRREIGELVVFGTWVPRSDSPDHSEPALAIVPRYREIGKPVVIALSAAYLYDDPRYAANACMMFNEALGFERSMTGAIKIASLIDDHISDLVSMPPEPTNAVVVADASMRGSDGSSRTIELLEHQSART